MSSKLSRMGRFSGHAIFAVLLLIAFLWSWVALSVQLSGTVYYIAATALILGTFLAFFLRRRARRLGWVGFTVVIAIVALWYQGIKPAQDKDWAFDVEHGVDAQVDGNAIKLSNVRNFNWTGPATADVSWEKRDYDLSKLQTVDMFTSVWDNPAIAHLVVSFGFSDDKHVAFSLETRKESTEEFNIIGGFFRQFELILLAATEEDVIKLRTNYREEDVRRYEVTMSDQQRRDLFMSYVTLAQELQEEPKFYNTLTANCTTEAFRLSKVVNPRMTPDWRLVLSGHLPEFVDAMGGFPDGIPIQQRIEDAAITSKALAYNGPDFSAAIRE